MTGYTVVDVETTGLSPQQHDRVVEMGVVYVSDYGTVQGEWSTLVNPGRDVGPTRIHGITAREVVEAPLFADVAQHLLRAVAGRTIVAHNARFDLGFLDYEFQRAGVPVHVKIPGLCTMQWSGTFLRGASRKLAHCCEAAGVGLVGAHSALGDARATAGLLTHYLKASGGAPPWGGEVRRTRDHPWPPYDGDPPAISMVQRSGGGVQHKEAWLDRIVAGMSRELDPVVESYLAVLEMALLDRYLSVHEQQSLIALAAELGLSRGRVLDIHATYLRQLAAVAWADDVITDDERVELQRVAQLLCLAPSTADEALDAARTAPAGDMGGPAFALDAGDRVVLTGDMKVSREVWSTRAAAAGLEVGGVTKKTKVVVAADPDSLSGKAAKARNYGIPVITETAFERLLQEM